MILFVLTVYKQSTTGIFPDWERAEPTVFVPLPLLPETFTLTDEEDSQSYFMLAEDGRTNCFKAGTVNVTNSTCQCRPGYYGTDCGIPQVVWLSGCPSLNKCSGIKARTKPRRLIHGLNVNHELEFFEMRLEEVGDVVDVFIVAESNLTAGGDPSPLYLLPELQKGFMSSFQHKILHVFIDQFPAQGLTDGWFADTFIRDHMGREGLKRISG